MHRPAVIGFALSAVLAIPQGAAAAGQTGPLLTSPTDRPDKVAISVTPRMLQLTVPAGQQRQRTLTLTNHGGAAITWQMADGSSTGRPPAAGTVLKSWDPQIFATWGIGVEGHKIWITDQDLLRNDAFTVDGVRLDEGWPTPWANPYPGPFDMAYVPDRGLMCQVKASDDNGIYCWNPRTGDVDMTIIGDYPWSALPQRGLAYRPDDDTFYVGGWDQGVIYHIEGLDSPNRGRIIGQCTPPERAIAGLGWSSSFGLLWMTTQGAGNLIYAINPDTCAPLRVITPPNPQEFSGGGLDLDTNDNLWLTSAFQSVPPRPGIAYLIASGLPSITDAPWLSATPRSGVLPAGKPQKITVHLDATGLTRGKYNATLYLITTGGQPLITVPVQLHVT